MSSETRTHFNSLEFEGIGNKATCASEAHVLNVALFGLSSSGGARRLAPAKEEGDG